MQILVAVVEAGSFTGAAKEVDLPKSSVSRRVSQLEDRLGIRLLQRTTRSVRLTSAGEVYFETAQRLLSEVADLETKVSGFSEEPKGLLRITCPAGFAANNSSLFAEFATHNPKVRIQVEETDRMVDLVAEKFDLAFRGGRPPDPSLSGFQLASSERILTASPAYLKRRGSPKKLKELANHDLLTLGSGHRNQWHLRTGRRESSLDLSATFATNNLRTLQEVTQSGLGIGLLPLVNCSEALERGTLVRVLKLWTASPASLWLVYPSTRGLASSVRAFLDLVKKWKFATL